MSSIRSQGNEVKLVSMGLENNYCKSSTMLLQKSSADGSEFI